MGLLGKRLIYFSPRFCKSCLKWKNPCLGIITKNLVPFLLMFPQGSVHLELLSTDITQPAGSLWLFMWKRHLGQWLVKWVEKILRKYWKSQNTIKKTAWIFLIPRQRYKHFQYLLQKQKVYLIGRFPSSLTYSVKNSRSTDLMTHLISQVIKILFVLKPWLHRTS